MGVTSRARLRSGDQAEMSGFRFEGDVGVEAHRFALDVMVRERLSFVVERHAAEVQPLTSVGFSVKSKRDMRLR